jgi:hypothetical protein
MAGNLSPAANMKLAIVTEFTHRVQRAHALVEQFASARTNQDALTQSLRRTFQQLKIGFMGAGYDALAQLSGAMEIAAARGGSSVAKARILREGVGQLRFQIELEQRSIVTEDRALQERAARQAEAEAEGGQQ